MLGFVLNKQSNQTFIVLIKRMKMFKNIILFFSKFHFFLFFCHGKIHVCIHACVWPIIILSIIFYLHISFILAQSFVHSLGCFAQWQYQQSTIRSAYDLTRHQIYEIVWFFFSFSSFITKNFKNQFEYLTSFCSVVWSKWNCSDISWKILFTLWNLNDCSPDWIRSARLTLA